MQRPIIAFQRDAHGDWTAALSCGHRQHVRHDPPFVRRPWVTTEAGRVSRLGVPLDCLRCDRFEVPEDMVPTSHTPEFTERTVPDGLKANHATAPGVWARIIVTTGRLRYRIDTLGLTMELTPEALGVVVPEVPHGVEPMGPVRFHVEFLRAPRADSYPPRAQ